MRAWHLAVPLAAVVVGLVSINVSLSELWRPRAKADVWLWAAAVTPTSFQLRVKGEGHLVVGPLQPPGPHVFSRRLQGAGVHSVTVEGLQPETEYFYGLVADPSQSPADPGRVKTWASGVQSSLRVGVASCATVGSDDPVFDEIADAKFDLFLQMGDLHYHDIQVNDTQIYLDAFAQVHGAPRQRRFFRSTPVAYVWDDHDFGGNDCNREAPSALAAREALRQAVPKPEVPGDELAAYHAFSVGRTRFLMVDARSESMPGGSIMSGGQMDWVLREIASPGQHRLLVLMLGQPWIGAGEPGEDGWIGHPADRKRISDAIAASAASGGYVNVLGVSGDAHMLAFDDGTNTDYSDAGGAGFPLLQAGPLDRSGSAKGGPYTSECMAYKLADTHQYGSLEITDSGGNDASAICVRFQMHRSGGGVLREDAMCGPLVGSRSTASSPCAIPLMPARQVALLVLVLLSLLLLVVLAVVWQRRNAGLERWLGWMAVGVGVLALLPQVVLFVVEKLHQLPLDPPWRPLLFQLIVQLVLLAALLALFLLPSIVRVFREPYELQPKESD